MPHATKLDARIVAESPIEAQKKILQHDSRSAVTWTREQLENAPLQDKQETRENKLTEAKNNAEEAIKQLEEVRNQIEVNGVSTLAEALAVTLRDARLADGRLSYGADGDGPSRDSAARRDSFL